MTTIHHCTNIKRCSLSVVSCMRMMCRLRKLASLPSYCQWYNQHALETVLLGNKLTDTGWLLSEPKDSTPLTQTPTTGLCSNLIQHKTPFCQERQFVSSMRDRKCVVLAGCGRILSKAEGQRSLHRGISWRGWEDNIKVDVEYTGGTA